MIIEGKQEVLLKKILEFAYDGLVIVDTTGIFKY